MNHEIKRILEAVQNNDMSVDEALLEIKSEPFKDIGFAKVDTHRKIRQGCPEVIYGAGKTAEQIIGILDAMVSSGENNVLITRISPEKAAVVSEKYDINYTEIAQIAVLGDCKKPDGIGTVAVITAGTSDMPVAEEAAITAEYLGNDVIRIYDAGVAGLHRLLAHKDEIMGASVIVAIAGMEGALASVVGGLADCPVIAVPTSVGYGASFHGVSALLSMLNSCANGIAVVNIDNGFGAAFMASQINHMEAK